MDNLVKRAAAAQLRQRLQAEAERNEQLKAEYVSIAARRLAKASDAIYKSIHDTNWMVKSVTENRTYYRPYRSREETLYREYVAELSLKVEGMTPEEARKFLNFYLEQAAKQLGG